MSRDAGVVGRSSRQEETRQVRGAADSIKPGVKRSGTPGTIDEIIQKPAKRPTADLMPLGAQAIGRSAGSVICLLVILGFRCAPPQALCLRPLRGLEIIFKHSLSRAFYFTTKLRP